MKFKIGEARSLVALMESVDILPYQLNKEPQTQIKPPPTNEGEHDGWVISETQLGDESRTHAFSEQEVSEENDSPPLFR